MSNLEGNGFLSSGGYPHVKLTDGTHDIVATNVDVISPQSVSCDFDLTGATVGIYSVVLENQDGGTDTLGGGFSVDWPPPELTAVTPPSGLNNGSVASTDLAGDHFRAGARVELMNGTTEIPATNVQVVSATKVTCDFDLTGAAVGKWDVYLENDDGEGATLPQAFTIEYPAPSVSGITPAHGYINGITDVTDLAGANFRAGATVKLARSGQPDITATDVNVVAASKITCKLDLTGAAEGPWDVVVTNDDAKAGKLVGGFDAGWSTTHIDSVAPDHGKPGDTVTIKGSNFAATNKASSVAFGQVPAPDVVSWSNTEIKVLVPVGASGSSPVVVTAPTGPSNSAAFTAFQPAWYLPEGSTAWGYTTCISVVNPNSDRSATVDVTYMIGTGAVSGGTFSIKPQSRLTIDPAAVVPDMDFSTRVVCREGFDIAVDRTMTWGGGIEGHNSIGVPGASRTWYLAEGSSAFGFETWLLVQNPGGSPAKCDITYMVEGQGPVKVTKTVPANSRSTFNMADDIGQKNASIEVQSDSPVIPERAMYRNNDREGQDSVGTTAPAIDFYLAEGSTAWGFTTWVLVQNPNAAPASVTLTYMTTDGPIVKGPVTVPAGSRLSIKANDQVKNTDTSIKVHGDRPIIAERAMYWDNGTGEACHDTIGLAGAHGAFYLPDGQTSNGRETWTLVQNPNSTDVTIEVTYMTDASGGNVAFTDVVKANSRKTYNMSAKLPSGRASVMVISKTVGKKVMVERSMYWNNKGAGTNTIGAYSD